VCNSVSEGARPRKLWLHRLAIAASPYAAGEAVAFCRGVAVSCVFGSRGWLLGALVVLAAVGTLARPAQAQEESCLLSSRVAVVVDRVQAPDVEIDVSKSASDLRALLERSSAGRRAGVTFGYYQAMTGYRYSLKAEEQRLPGGDFCIAVTELFVRFGFGRRIVSFAREAREYPCVGARIAAHEHEHVRVDEETLKVYLARLQTALERDYALGLVMRAHTLDASKAALKVSIETRLRQAVGEFAAYRQQSQQQLDEHDEEVVLRKECGAEADAFLNRYR